MSKIDYKYNVGDIVYFLYEDKPYVGEIETIKICGRPVTVHYKIKFKMLVKGYNYVYDTTYADVKEDSVFDTKDGLIQHLTESIKSLNYFNM